MLKKNELQVGDVYVHDNGRKFALLVTVVGDSESGGAVTVEMSGTKSLMGLALFMRKFNVIKVPEMKDDATEKEG